MSTLTIKAEQIGFYKTNEKLGNSGFTTFFLGQNYSVDLSQIQRGKDWGPKKVTIYLLIFYLVKSSESILFFYLHFNWLCGS